MQIYADITAPATLHDRIGAGARPGVGDPRCRRRRDATRTSRAAAAVMGSAPARRLHARSRKMSRPMRNCSRSTARLHDCFGRGSNDVMHRLEDPREPPVRRPGRSRVRHGPAARLSAGARHERAAGRHRRIRHEVCALHAELTRYGLVVWTAGNVSARVPGYDLMVIKPSGVSYDELTPDLMVVTDLWQPGHLRAPTPGPSRANPDLSPSSDTAAHAYVYRHMPEVGGVVHTHSTYATAWAARGEAIPCVLTMMADEFGGDHPGGPVRADRGRLDRPRHRGDPAGHQFPGRADARTTDRSPSARTPAPPSRPRSCARKSPAPCTSPGSSAIRCPSPPARSSASTTATRTSTAAGPTTFGATHARRQRPPPSTPTRSGSSPAASTSTARRPQAGRRPVAGDRRRSSTPRSDVPVRIVWKPVLTDSDAIRRTALEANADDAVIGVMAWMHTF